MTQQTQWTLVCYGLAMGKLWENWCNGFCKNLLWGSW